MYDELIAVLRHCGSLPCEGCPRKTCEGAMANMCEAADAIEELTEVIQNHDFLESLIKPCWVPTTEQKPPLPEDEDVCYVQVIAAVKGKKEAEPVLYSRAYRLRDGKRVRIERFVGDGEVLEVTHWMPMPEPPKEEA